MQQCQIGFISRNRLGQKSTFYPKKKITYWQPQFLQNSPFWILNFHKIHTSEFSIFTKFTLLNSHFSQNSHFWKIKIKGISGYKVDFAPVWYITDHFGLWVLTGENWKVFIFLSKLKIIEINQRAWQLPFEDFVCKKGSLDWAYWWFSGSRSFALAMPQFHWEPYQWIGGKYIFHKLCGIIFIPLELIRIRKWKALVQRCPTDSQV